MVSSITQNPYSIMISLNLASSVNLNIGAPPRPAELAVCIRGLVGKIDHVRTTATAKTHLI